MAYFGTFLVQLPNSLGTGLRGPVASGPRMLSGLALAVLTGLVVGCTSAIPAATGPATTESLPATAHLPAGLGPAPQTLSETGSTLLYPLLKAWAAAYHQRFGQVTIPTAGTGSSAGIKAAETGTATIGASDAYLSSGTLVASPTLLNIPLAIAAQQVNYNVPGIPPGKHLNLTGAVLAQMYSGAIKTWNAPPVQSLNPGVHLPGTPVIPLHRGEGSGDTFLFTSYLATGDAHWNTVIGYGTTVAWPAIPAARAIKGGNLGMVSACHATPGCVAYVGIAYLMQARAAASGPVAAPTRTRSISLRTARNECSG
jgi:phosphate transport system substrate-binding protein